MPSERFVDVQLSGPYRLWHHTHEFRPHPDGGTLMTDTVRYALPFGPLGPWRTGCWCAGTSSGSSTSGRGPCGGRGLNYSVDGERALHARGLVAGDRAVERVGSGLQVGGGGRGLARLPTVLPSTSTPLPSIATACGMWDGLAIESVTLPALAVEARLVELQRALVGCELERLATAAARGGRVASASPWLARGAARWTSCRCPRSPRARAPRWLRSGSSSAWNSPWSSRTGAR